MSGAVPFSALLRSEWTKLRSLRSTWWCSALYLLGVGGVGWMVAARAGTAPDPGAASNGVLTGFGVGQLLVLVLGVLSVTSEFTSGTALVSLTVAPRRTRLLLAKTLTVTAYCTLLTAALAGVCAGAAYTLTAVPDGVAATSPEVLRALGLQVAGGAPVAVLGVALGAVLRSTLGAVGLGAALVLLLPPALTAAGGAPAAQVARALPAVRVGEEAFFAGAAPWPVAMAVLAAWSLVAWSLGAVLVERRDA